MCASGAQFHRSVAPNNLDDFALHYQILYDLEYNPRDTIYFWRSKVGVLFEGGLIEGGFNKFRPEGAKFFTFFSQTMHFYAVH